MDAPQTPPESNRNTEPGPGIAAAQYSADDMLLNYLASRDVPCPACGYNLRQLKQNVCPECGNEFQLSVGLVDRTTRSWITALVAALLPAGCGLPFLVMVVIAILFMGATPGALDLPLGTVAILGYTLLCLIASVLLLIKRGPFLRLRRQTQSNIAFALVACDIAWVLGIVGYIVSV